MHPYHLKTAHTRESVRRGRSTMDWQRQPLVFKHYPDEYPLVALDDVPELKDYLYLCAGLSAKKIYPGDEYFLRVHPSAGALYPCELYIQAREVEGLADGIYHFEPQGVCLRLLYTLHDNEGIEACCPDQRRISGLMLLVSAIYYRSSWKYRSRALRYCLLDAGHLLGAIETASWCMGRPFQVGYRLDRDRLAGCFGFGSRELIMALAVSGQRAETLMQEPGMNLPFVDGSGHHREDRLIEQSYAACCSFSTCRRGLEQKDLWPVATAEMAETVVARRSIRKFKGHPMSLDQYTVIQRAVQASINSDCDLTIRVWSVINRVDGLQRGLYDGLSCIRPGDFSNLAGYLCLEQALGADSGVTLFFSAAGDNYLPLMIKAGIIGQRIYLAATILGMGCSGIGAFYDQEMADFLQTDEQVLYALAVGY